MEAAKWVRSGVKLWTRQPRTCSRKQKVLTKTEEDFLDREVERMLQMGAITPSERSDLILSSIYTVPKKEKDKRRPVVNLRWVNSHLENAHYH